MRNTVEAYIEFLDSVEELIDDSGLKPKFIYDKMGMDKSVFYSRKIKPLLWKPSELLNLIEILEIRFLSK